MECPNSKHRVTTSSPPVTEESGGSTTAIKKRAVEIPDPEETAVEEEEDLKVPKVPCIYCFAPVPGPPNGASKCKVFKPVTPEEIEIDKLFQWFLLHFRERFVPRKKSKKKGPNGRAILDWGDRFDQLIDQHSSVGWDGEGGRSWPLPFCGECRNEVVGLMEWKNRIKSIGKGKKAEEDGLREAILEGKRKMGRCEQEFFDSGIYEKDTRYRRVRNDILKIHWRRSTVATMRKQMVKEEVTEVMEDVLQREERGMEGMEVPCVICCETLKIFPEAKKTMKDKVENMRMFKWFLHHLKNPPDQVLFEGQLKLLKYKRLKKKGVRREEKWNMGWDGHGGKSEPLQFCGRCREGIMECMDSRYSENLVKERRRWVRTTKQRMRECEEIFEKSGIYERDPRYFNVRRKVIKIIKKKKDSEKRKPEVDQVVENKKGKKVSGKGCGKMRGDRAKEQMEDFYLEWDDDDELSEEGESSGEDEEEPPIGYVKDEELGGMDPLGLDTDTSGSDLEESEEEDAERIQVKEENNLEYLTSIIYQSLEEYKGIDPLGLDTGAMEAMEGEEDENEKVPHRNCLLCYKAISKKESSLAPVLTNDLNEQNFNVVFILRKMLNVPKDRLVGYLENFGCPGKWVEYCKNCLGMVDVALRIQKEISELEDKLRKCQEKMVQKIKSTCKKRKNCEKVPEERRMMEETRQFVSFPEGQKKKLKENEDRPPVDVMAPPPEVAIVSNVNDNEPLELSPSSPSPPPSPPDDTDIDPSYVEDANCPPEQDDLHLEKSPAKRIKLSVNAKVKQRAADNSKKDTGQKFLETLQEKIYICSLCPNLQQPMSLVKFYKHIIFHDQRPFKCSICNLYWSSPSELQNNPLAEAEHPSNSNEHLCSEATLVKLPPENGKYYPGEIWNCKWCPIKFNKETERDSHEDHVHSSFKNELVLEWKCLSCSKAYRSYREWLLHRVLEHPKIAAISCLCCDYSVSIKTKEGIDVVDWFEIKQHTSLEHSACKNLFISMYTCDFCGISYRYKTESLANHIKADHLLTSGHSTFGCPCCHYRTGALRSLKMHLYLRHALDPPPFTEGKDEFKKCDICGKEGLDSVQLCDHKMVKHGLEPEAIEEYSGEKIHRCGKGDECGGFRTVLKRHLRAHMRAKHGAKRKEQMTKKNKRQDQSDLETDEEDHNFDNQKLYSGNEGGFTCSLCPALTIERNMSLGKFYRHLIFHLKRPFKCNICNLYWSGASELEKNPFVKKSGNLSDEHVCSEATLVRSPPDGKFNPGKIWRCGWCPDKKFEMEVERDLHENEEHLSLKNGMKMKWKCLSCSSKAYRSHEEWLLHRVLEHPSIAVISCLFCDFTSVTITKEGIEILNSVEMRKHTNSEHQKNKYLFFGHHDFCDFCGDTFECGKAFLAHHIRDVHKAVTGGGRKGALCPAYSCPCCHQRFEMLRHLSIHLRKGHSHDPRLPSRTPAYRKQKGNGKVICDICGISFLCRLHLCDHKMSKHDMKLEEMEEYKGDKVLECERGDECGGYRTLRVLLMKEHMMKKHGAERKWKCEECGKGFTDGYKLKCHKEIHKNKFLKPYQCEICGNSFALKNYLYIHKRLSHQNRPFASTNRKRTKKSQKGSGIAVTPPPSGSKGDGTILPVPFTSSTFFPPTQLATSGNSRMMEGANLSNDYAMDLT